MNHVSLLFDVLLAKSSTGHLVIKDGPPRILKGSTLAYETYLPDYGSCVVVKPDDIGDFLRQLFNLELTFAFGG